MRVSLFLLSPRCYRACLCSQQRRACWNHSNKYSHTRSAKYQHANLCPRGRVGRVGWEELLEKGSESHAWVWLLARERQRVLLLPDKHHSRTKCNAWPSIDSHSTPCLSVEGTGPVLDHFPCIDQSKWNDLSGTQQPGLM